tara:strand:+ start:1048 stop:1647 length:600 start_codon:yes stop_codon:yes gene_type:complete
MLFNFLSNVIFIFKKITTPKDYHVVKEELEYSVDYNLKYLVEDTFWRSESKDWDGILENFYVNVTGSEFRHTSIPQNVKDIVLRVKYFYNGHLYTVITNDINFLPGENEDSTMHFSIPLTSVWIVDHDDKPMVNITEKVKRYAGPRGDFHKEKVPLKDFLYYEHEHLEKKMPKIMLANGLGMKKIVSTLTGFTTDLRIP